MESMMSHEDKYFVKWLEEKFENLESKIDANTKVTEKTAKRVSDLEQMASGEPIKKDLPPIYRDPKVIQTALYLSIAVMLLVAAAVRFDVSKLL